MEEGTAEGGILFRSLTSVTSVEQGGKDGVCFSSRAVPCPERLSIIVGAKQRFSALQPINRRRHGASFTCLTVSSYGYPGRRRIAAGLQRLKGNHLQNHGRGRFYYRRLQAPSKVGHSDNLPTSKPFGILSTSSPEPRRCRLIRCHDGSQPASGQDVAGFGNWPASQLQAPFPSRTAATSGE